MTIYIVLGVLYESFIHPLTILSTLPSAGVGALLALMLFGYDLSVIALIGIVLLMGIVKKNAIMMIDFALEAERGQGMSPRDAIVQASLLRFRPIMMTTLAALFGALPLALESGTGSELRNPLGITIIGGLLLSQLLTLYTTPVIYLAMERLKQRFSRTEPFVAPVPRPDRDAAAAPRRSDGDELLHPVHPPAGRHHAAGDRPVSRRRGGLSASCRCRACRRSSSRPSASRRAGPAPIPRSWRRPSRRRSSAGSAKSPASPRSPRRSSLGTTNITIQFDLDRNIDGAARDVQAALNAALTDLPGDLPTLPAMRKVNPSAAPILILALTSKTMLAERHLRRRRQRHRAAHRRRSTASPRSPSTAPSSRRSASASIRSPSPRWASSLEDVRTAIANANAASPLGTFDGADLAPTPSAPTISSAPCPNTRTWW